MLFQKAQKKLNGNQNKIGRKNKERTRSLNRWYLSSPIGRILLTLSEKVSLCTSCAKIKKAGLSVETALVLPLFFLGMVTMISFMDIYSLQTTHLQALCEKTKEAGMYAYVADGNGPDGGFMIACQPLSRPEISGTLTGIESDTLLVQSFPVNDIRSPVLPSCRVL